MLRWIRTLFGRKDAAGYAAAERELFPFWDGRRTLYADPLAAHRALLTDKQFDVQTDPKVCTVPTQDGLLALGRTAAAVRRAFGLPAYDPVTMTGLTDDECSTLFCRFGEFVADLTESRRPLASSPGSTESPAAGGSTTPLSAAST